MKYYPLEFILSTLEIRKRILLNSNIDIEACKYGLTNMSEYEDYYIESWLSNLPLILQQTSHIKDLTLKHQVDLYMYYTVLLYYTEFHISQRKI